MSIIASDPDAADSSLEELVCSLTELIVMLEGISVVQLLD
jgi:hypothetical protein